VGVVEKNVPVLETTFAIPKYKGHLAFDLQLKPSRPLGTKWEKTCLFGVCDGMKVSYESVTNLQ
jgi:hypothetical protein